MILTLELDAEVSGTIRSPQPDVGIMTEWVDDASLVRLSLNGRQLPEAALHLLEPFLLSDDDIRDEVEDAILGGRE